MNLFELVNNVPTLCTTYTNGHIQPILVVGAPGIAKTTVIETVFAETWGKFMGKPVSVLNFILSTMDPPDVMGLPVIDRSNPEYVFYRYAVPNIIAQIRQAAHYHDGLVLVNLDEYTQCDASMQKVISDLVYNYRIGNYDLPPNVWIVMTGNRMQDSSGVSRQLAMLTNRVPRFEVELPIEHYARYARANALPPICVAFAERFPNNFVSAVPPREGAFCTPRSFTGFARYLKAYNSAHSKDLTHVEDNTFTRSLAYGMIGEAASLEFFAFAKVAEQLPSRRDVLSNPDTAVVPMAHAVDAQYAACNMAMSLAMEDILNQVPALRYIMRLPTIELAVKSIIELNKHSASVTMNNPEAVAFLAKHKALVMDAAV